MSPSSSCKFRAVSGLGSELHGTSGCLNAIVMVVALVSQAGQRKILCPPARYKRNRQLGGKKTMAVGTHSIISILHCDQIMPRTKSETTACTSLAQACVCVYPAHGQPCGGKTNRFSRSVLGNGMIQITAALIFT